MKKEKIAYWVGSFRDFSSFYSLKEAKFYGRRDNLSVVTIKIIQDALPVGEKQRIKNKINEKLEEIRSYKKYLKQLKSEDTNNPFGNDIGEQWSRAKYTNKVFKRK